MLDRDGDSSGMVLGRSQAGAGGTGTLEREDVEPWVLGSRELCARYWLGR
jgi:hypothetical protein